MERIVTDRALIKLDPENRRNQVLNVLGFFPWIKFYFSKRCGNLYRVLSSLIPESNGHTIESIGKLLEGVLGRWKR